MTDTGKRTPPRGPRGPRTDRRPGKPGEKRSFRGPRRDEGDKRDFKPRGDRPEGDRPFRERSDRPRRDFKPREDRPDGERSYRPRGDRPEGDRPRRDFKPRGDRPFRDRGDRPQRDFKPREDRPDGERRPFRGPRREEGERSYRPRGDRPEGDRPRRDFKPRGDRPERGDRPFRERSDRPQRDFKPREDRPDGERRPFRGPRREEGERSYRPRGDRPEGDRPRRDFKPRGDRPERGDRPFRDRGDRPQRDFKPREDRGPRRDDGDRPFRSHRPEGRGPQERGARPDPNLDSRRAALNCLMDVFNENRTLDQALTMHAAELPVQEKKLCHALAAAVLRHTRQLDAAAAPLLTKPLIPNSDAQNILRIGLAQLMVMDGIKPHAAVHTTVNLAKEAGGEGLAKLMNALLRKIQGQGLEATEGSVPDWLADLLRTDYPADAEALIPALTTRATVDLRVRDAELAPTYRKMGAKRLPYTTDGWRLPVDTNPKTLPGIDKHQVYIQDAAAQLPAKVLLNGIAKEDAPHINILDMCAAPGGKTLQLLDALPNVTITALDQSSLRLGTLRRNLGSKRDRVQVMAADGTKLPFEDNLFTAVLLDAPCTATGTSRRHPEVLHRRSPSDILGLTTLQQDMLAEAWRVLAPGGVLVYAVCALPKAEGEQQIANFVANTSNAKRMPIAAAELPGLENALTSEGEARCLPSMEMDGFFISRLQKTA